MSCKPAHSTAAPWGCEESSEAAVVSRTAPAQKPPWDVSLEGSVDEQPAQPKYGAGAQSYQPPTQSFKPAHNTEAPWGADGHTDAPVLPKYGAGAEQIQPTQSFKPAHNTQTPWGDGAVESAPVQSYQPPTQSFQPPTQSFKPAHNTEAPWGADGHTVAPVLPKYGAHKDTSLWNNDQNEAPTSRSGLDFPHDAQGAAQATYAAQQTMQSAKLRNAGQGSLW